MVNELPTVGTNEYDVKLPLFLPQSSHLTLTRTYLNHNHRTSVDVQHGFQFWQQNAQPAVHRLYVT